MDISEDNVFGQLIKQCLLEWKSLQLAISEGMGGPEALAKREWMAEVIVDYFRDFPDTTEEELEEYVDTIVNNEFDTLIEDGSLEHLVLFLCKYHRMHSAGKDDDLKKVLEDKVSTAETLVAEEMEVDSKLDEVTFDATTAGPSSDPSEDGWTVVRRKGKK